MNTGKLNTKQIAIIAMCFLLAMIAFVTNMAAPFGTIWGYKYEWAGMMGNMMNFAAYLFIGIPAGKMLANYGYKKTALMAMGVGIIGLVIQYLSSQFGNNISVFTYQGQAVGLNLLIYLTGAFICGFCVCMLNTVVNPMLNLLGGGGNKGNQLIQIGGTLSSLTATLTPLLVGVLVKQLNVNTSINDVTPLLFIGIGVFIISFFVILTVNIPEPQQATKTEKFYTPLKFKHCRLGVLAIFFYVGIEVGIPAELNFYISNMGFEGSAALGGTMAAAYWLVMMGGRAIGSVIGRVSTSTQMTFVSALAILLLLVAIGLPESISIEFKGNPIPIKCFLIIACGLSTSIMWDGIFNLSVEGLGKYTAAASGLFMTMVVGGGIMPFIQHAIAQKAGAINSYWLIIAMLIYVLYYSKLGCRITDKNNNRKH